MEYVPGHEALGHAVTDLGDAERLLNAARMILSGCDIAHEELADPLRGVVDCAIEKICAAREIMDPTNPKAAAAA
jgi:hypothetical protein